MPRYTLHGSTLKDDIAALREEIAALKADAAAREDAAPEITPVTSTAREDLKRTGHAMKDARVAAEGVAKRWCPRHKHGFAFDKKVCPRDGQAIPQ